MPLLSRPALSALSALSASAALVACSASEPAAPPVEGELVFVRGGVVSPIAGEAADGEGQPLPGGGRLVARDWQPGETVSLDGIEGVAPREAECLTLFQVDLGDVARLVAMGGSAPNTALAWSPGGDRLAVGSYRGEVLVVDGWTGEVQARRQLAETMVKALAWSPDGGTLYAGEQSPDAYVRALDPATLGDRWTLRLADRVESSPAPPAEDIYGVYTLPAAYGLLVLRDGSLFLTALHSWFDAAGTKRNLSQALRVSPAGEVLAEWPEAPVAVTLAHPRLDEDSGYVAFTVNHSADGAPPEGLPVGGVQVLDLETMTPVVGVLNEGLAPHFQEAFVWEALDVDRDQDALLMGFGDGRVRVTDLRGADRLGLTTGAPVMAGEVPIHASVGWGFLHGDGLVYSTGRTLIPWGAASPDLRPPSSHPAENTVHHVGLDGTPRWSWSTEREIQGLSLGPDGRSLVVGAGSRGSDSRRDLYGAVILDLGGEPGRSGTERQRAVCSTEGPVFFRHAMTADGRLALTEHPWREEDESVQGSYRLTVMR